MLTMLEEVVLLAVDEKTGGLRSTREFGTSYALVGAVLFDLSLAGKIDTDTEIVEMVDGKPTGNATLDRVLVEMGRRRDLNTVQDWIEHIYLRKADLEGEALASLAQQGILRHEKAKRMWFVDVERFPVVNDKPQQHVKVRLAEAIRTDGIPDTRDIMLISIAEKCGLLPFVVDDTELARRHERIQTLCNLETISRKVARAIGRLDGTLRTQMMPRML